MIFSNQPCACKQPIAWASEYYPEYHFFGGGAQNVVFCGIFPFSMTFDILKTSMTSPGLEIIHSNSMIFPGFP